MKVCGIDKDRLEVEFHGPIDAMEVKRLFDEIVDIAGKNKCKAVLVDGRGIEGLPGVMQAYEMVCGLKTVKENGLKVALVHDDERFVNDKFSVSVAEYRMIKYRKFLDRKDALEWIDRAQ